MPINIGPLTLEPLLISNLLHLSGLLLENRQNPLIVVLLENLFDV